jgi:hypothetical protein
MYLQAFILIPLSGLLKQWFSTLFLAAHIASETFSDATTKPNLKYTLQKTRYSSQKHLLILKYFMQKYVVNNE